jgi:hypothetical protein
MGRNRLWRRRSRVNRQTAQSDLARNFCQPRRNDRSWPKLTVCFWCWLVRKQQLVPFAGKTTKRTRFTTAVFICSDSRSFSPTTEPNEQAPLPRMRRPASAVTISAAICVAIGVRIGA